MLRKRTQGKGHVYQLIQLLQMIALTFPSAFLLLSLQMALGHILRLPCTKYGNFSLVKEDHELIGDTLEEFSNINAKECEYECIQHPLCKSINVKNAPGINCKINRKTTEDQFDVVTLSLSPGWTYKTTDYQEQNIGKLCQVIKPCPQGATCMDSCTCPGFHCHQLLIGNASTCQVLYRRGARQSQVYKIFHPGIGNLDVRCDMETDGGGWIVFQRRVNAAVDFYRDWSAYKNGFGDLNGNFWIGLEKLHKLAGRGKGAILRVDLKHMDKQGRHFALYGIFEVGSEADKYRLTVGQYSGDAGDSLSSHNNMCFTTLDRDNDHWPGNCGMSLKGGWWFYKCYSAHLNGVYPSTNATDNKNMGWKGFFGNYGGITFSEMKIRYRSP